jgi:hypothetical protein
MNRRICIMYSSVRKSKKWTLQEESFRSLYHDRSPQKEEVRDNNENVYEKESTVRSQATQNKQERSMNIVCIEGICALVVYLPFLPVSYVSSLITPYGMAAVLALSADQQSGTHYHSPQQLSSRPLSSSFGPTCPSGR